MTPDQHAHVKQLFLKARELSDDQRDEFLRQECGDDMEMIHEVTSLIRHDSADTILTRTTRPQFYPFQQIGRPPNRVLGQFESAVNQTLRSVFGNRIGRLIVISGVVLFLIALATWTHGGMMTATKSIAASELQTLLNAEVKALDLWIEEKKKDVRLWSSRPEIREGAQQLIELSKTSREPEVLRAAPALVKLRKALDKFDRIVGRPEKDGLITRDGLILAAGQDESIGEQLKPDEIAALVPVFGGETIFLRPEPDRGYDAHQGGAPEEPLLFFVGPIRRDDSPDSEIVAACAFGFPAENEFTSILSVARQGETGETFAFDENGLLLNESRFDEELRRNGLLPNDPQSRSLLNIEIRDPGPRPEQWQASSVQAAERPLTVLAARAIAAGRKGSESEMQGVVIEPYRNYRGRQVIGAWRWLSAYGMGVATEVEAEEQFAPTRYPIIAAWIRFGMLVGAVLSLLAAAAWIVMLGREVEEARQLGQYTLQEVVGKGGMGVVYRAQHAFLQRPTAIKVLRPEMINESSLARFEREAQLASQLTHPNTVEIFDFGPTPEGSFYCVMEYLDGRTLEDIVRSDGPLPVDRTVNILKQIAGSLNEAHQHGLVHRDIKPSNIMLCRQGGIADFVKVLDFGLARPVQRTDNNDVTQLGLVAGTPPYLAPERITDPVIIDQRSDIYSFGAVGYYLLTGHHIFRAETNDDLIQQILTESPDPPSQATDREIPTDLDDLIASCLARNVEDRPASMQDILIDVARMNARLQHRAMTS